jgi:hypothetical protein
MARSRDATPFDPEPEKEDVKQPAAPKADPLAVPKLEMAVVAPKEPMGPKQPAKKGDGLRPFNNRMLSFPPDILEAIDKKILNNASPQKLIDFLRDSYKGGLDIPTRQTIAVYIKWRKERLFKTVDANIRSKKELAYTEVELREMYAKLKIAETDPSDKRALLEKIMVFLLHRVEMGAQIQDNLSDPRYEQVLTNQLQLVKGVSETLLKMEGQLGANEFIARRMVERFFSELVPILQALVQKHIGQDKAKIFLDQFKKEVKTIDFQKIKHESIMEASAMEDSDGIGKSIGSDPA